MQAQASWASLGAGPAGYFWQSQYFLKIKYIIEIINTTLIDSIELLSVNSL